MQALIDAGFDGVYLDWVEAYSDENVIFAAEQDGIDPVAEMKRWVADMAAFGRAQKPDLIVIAQNAAELATHDDYLSVIDAIAQEQVWFDGGAEDRPPGDCPLPRTEAEVDSQAYFNQLPPDCKSVYRRYPESSLHTSSEWYLNHLKTAHDKGKVIFTVDYALEPENVAWVYRTARNLGFIPFVTERGLSIYLEPTP
jgi:cysteinyl-tRNA synthetase